MLRTPGHLSAVMMGALGLAGSAWAQTGREVASPVDTLSPEELRYVQSLESRIAQLEARPAPSATVDSVMTSAQVQSQAPAATLSGYRNGRFMLSSEDGNFTLQPYIQAQVRYVANYADQDGFSWDSGYEIRRLRFGAQGNLFSKDLSYKFQWASNRNGGTVSLEDAEVAYRLSPEWAVFAGQFKDPTGHEELMSPTRQLAAERSLVNALLTGGVSDYVQGIGANYKKGPWETWVAVHDGQNSDNTNFQNGATDWGASARAEYLVRGDKKDYSDFTARGTKSELLVVGAGADISGLANENRLLWVIDAQYENTTGLGLFASVNGASIQGHGDNDDDTNFGFLVQAGKMLDSDAKWEAFGRYGFIHYESAAENISEITGGVNRYFYGHNLKATADVTILPNGSPAETGLGYVDSLPDAQYVLRVQLQLML